MKSFPNFTTDRSYYTKCAPIVKVDYWNAMSEADSLRLTQQRFIRKFLTIYFGSRIVESEKKLDASTKCCANYIRHDFEVDDGKYITVWHHSLPDLLQL